MHIRNTLLTITSLTALSACASIVEGSTQQVSVQTNPQMAANCQLQNERGTWRVQSPGQVSVKRSKSDLNVQCTNQQYSGRISNSSDAESWGIGNVIAGGVIGAGVDAGTGALFSYDDNIIVPMMQRYATTPAANAAPILPGNRTMQPQPTYRAPTPTAPQTTPMLLPTPTR